MNIGNKIQSFLLPLFIFFCAQIKAQTVVEQAVNLWENQQLVQAKETIDQYLTGEGENDATAWLLKTRIYADLGADLRYRGLVADPEMEAFEALIRAVQLDKVGITQRLRADHSVVSNLYKTVNSRAISFFNAGIERGARESYSMALDVFRQALRISAFMHQMNWGMPALDTNLVYNTAQAAINAGNEDQAVLYAKSLADKSVFQTVQHLKADFRNVYHWLVTYYTGKDDLIHAEWYAEKALLKYPEDWYLHQTLIAIHRKSGNYHALFKVEERAVKLFPDQSKVHLAYCKDLFNFLYQRDVKEKPAAYTRLEGSLNSFINKYPAIHAASILLARHYFNKAADEQKAKQSATVIRQSLGRCVQLLKEVLQKEGELTSEERDDVLALLIGALEALERDAEADGYRKKLTGAGQ